MRSAVPARLPGLTARAASDDDVQGWWDLLDRAAVADHPQWRYSVGDLHDELHAEGQDPALHSVVGLDADGVVRAVAQVGLRAGDVEHLRLLVDGIVDPAWRGRGVGSGLLAWGEAVATDRAADRRADLGPVPAAVQCWVEEHRRDFSDLCAARGMTVERWFHTMRQPLTTVPATVDVPAGYRLVGLDEVAGTDGWAAFDDALRLAHNETFADHWGSQPCTVSHWATFVTGGRDFRPDWSVVALDASGEIAAYALVHAHEQDWAGLGFSQADLGNLGVRRPHRGAGLARALLRAVAARAHASGMAAVSLEVDSENPSGAVGLYERAGYRTEHRAAVWARTI